MKKMKFTLGLMLSMLFLGANVSQAQLLNPGLPHSGAIETAIYVQGCDFYSADIKFDKMYTDADGGYGYPALATTATKLWGTSFNKDAVKFDNFAFKYFPSEAWPYGSGYWVADNGLVPLNRRDFYFDLTANKYVVNNSSGSNSLVGGNLFYWLTKSRTEVYNRIEVSLEYMAGNELKPIIKRYLTVGEWITVVNNDPKDPEYGFIRNELFSTGIVIEQIIEPDSTWFRPHMDRATEDAIYIWKDDILSLLRNQIIYSIDYEIAVYDEIDNIPAPGNYPPATVLPKDARKLYIEPAAGITTNPNSIGTAIFTPSLKDFTFVAESESEITAETVTLLRPYDREELNRKGGKGVIVTKTGVNTYAITVQYVNQEMVIVVNSEASLNSATGNFVIKPINAVWGASGTLFVETAKTATLSIYSVTGQLIKQMSVSGSLSMTLPKGLYIVKIDDQAYKVIN